MLQFFSYYITCLNKDFVGYCNHHLQQMGLSQGLLFFILYIGKHPGCSPSELSIHLKMDSGHTTRSLDKLEQSGFLLRKKNELDKRAYALWLTQKGTKAFKASHDLFPEWDKEFLKNLSPQERVTLLTLLEKMTSTKGDEFCVRNDK